MVERSVECVEWKGSLLWPQSLPDAEIIDVSQVSDFGVWVVDELRQRGRRRLVGLSPLYRQLFQDCEHLCCVIAVSKKLSSAMALLK